HRALSVAFNESDAMDRENPVFLSTASAMAIWPIIGMLGGLLLGSIRASLQRADEFASLSSTIRWGVTGFFLGLALIVLLSFSLKQSDITSSRNFTSLRRLMVIVVVAALLSWYFTKILFGVIGY